MEKAEKDSKVWSGGVTDNRERGKLLLEIYNGGTFKKSMNYNSFRDSDRQRYSAKISKFKMTQNNKLDSGYSLF